MRGEPQRAMEAGLGLACACGNACIGPGCNIFRSGALRISLIFLIAELCFSIRTVWDDYRYEGSYIDDTRHLGQLVRVSANFQALRNTVRHTQHEMRHAAVAQS